MNSKYKLLIPFLAIAALLGCRRDEITEPVDDGLPPSVPTGLYVYYAYDGEIGIEWNQNPEPDISHYVIYRRANNSNEYLKIANTFDYYFVEDSLEYDSTYYYVITAIDEYNRESDFSNETWATPKNIFRPTYPWNIKINARNWNDSISINLFWTVPFDSDIDKYEIYRSIDPDFTPSNEAFIGSAKLPEYIDGNNLERLRIYYYKIITVDKGRLKSNPSSIVRDVILNSPEIVFPENNSEIKELNQYIIKTVSLPAEYTIVLQSNEIYGTLKEINFSTGATDSEFPVDANYYFEKYRDYYIKVFVYSGYSEEPNSFSAMYKFRITP